MLARQNPKARKTIKTLRTAVKKHTIRAKPPKKDAVFAILGHGMEDTTVSFNSRHHVPKGYTLVTFSECGVSVLTESLDPFIITAANPSAYEILSHPKENKPTVETIIKKKIRVYTEGQLMPSLTVLALSDWDNYKVFSLAKSGVYSLPFNPEIVTPGTTKYPHKKLKLKEDPETGKIHNITPQLETEIRKAFEGSIFPPIDTIDKDLNVFKKSVTFPLETILSACGPGVYYILTCRESNETQILADALKSRFSDYSWYNAYFTHNMNVSTRDHLYPMLPTFMSKLTEHPHSKNENAVKLYNNFQRIHSQITDVRKRSQNQQDRI